MSRGIQKEENITTATGTVSAATGIGGLYTTMLIKGFHKLFVGVLLNKIQRCQYNINNVFLFK
jgi:hypothetical protein